MIRVLIGGLAFCLAALGNNQPLVAQSSEGLRIEGKLSSDDPKDTVRKESHQKVHKFRMQQGKTYVIDLKSKKFDSYLRVEDSTGKQLAEDDDSGGRLNARLTFKAPKTDEYRLIATTASPATGTYTLTAREQTAAEAKYRQLQTELAGVEKKLQEELGKAEDRAKLIQKYVAALTDHLKKTAELLEQYADDAFAESARRDLFLKVQALSQAEVPEARKALKALAEAPAKSLKVALAFVSAEKLIKQYEQAYQGKDKSAAQLYQKAEKTLADLVKDARGVPEVEDALFELRYLTPGKKAPEIEAEDIDGKKFKLSDYRGKVVLLDFWGNW
jgi:hypothetical protein